MSDRRKYALNGVGFFENAQEHMERNNFPRIPIGTIGSVNGWYLTMEQKIINNEGKYHPFIYTRETKPTVKIRHFLGFLKNNGLSDSPYEYSGDLVPVFGPCGRQKTVDELSEENGYLTNGGIKMEYGFQIEGILNKENIWTFNFHDRLFDCQEKLNMITFHKDSEEDGLKPLHCHKQLLTHHSTVFNSNSIENQMIELTDENMVFFNHMLQFSHGVRVGVGFLAYYDVLKYAQKYKLFNVIRLLDQLMVLNEDEVRDIYPHAILFDLKHCLPKFLKAQKTSKELAEPLKRLDLKTMTTGEVMKKCVKRFFEF